MIAILTDSPAKDRMVQEAFFSKGFKWLYAGTNLKRFDPQYPYKFINSFTDKLIDGAGKAFFFGKDTKFIGTEEFLEKIDEYLEEKVIDNL